MKDNVFEELHYHSGLVAQGCWNELDDYDRDAIKRFGDLVVKEAIRIVQARCIGDHNREDAEVVRCVTDLKKHFGVTE